MANAPLACRRIHDPPLRRYTQQWSEGFEAEVIVPVWRAGSQFHLDFSSAGRGPVELVKAWHALNGASKREKRESQATLTLRLAQVCCEGAWGSRGRRRYALVCPGQSTWRDREKETKQQSTKLL